VFCVLPTYLALSYEASKIWKLSRRLPADFQELPLSAVTRLVVFALYLGQADRGFARSQICNNEDGTT
jgi:hypothetical protein